MSKLKLSQNTSKIEYLHAFELFFPVIIKILVENNHDIDLLLIKKIMYIENLIYFGVKALTKLSLNEVVWDLESAI